MKTETKLAITSIVLIPLLTVVGVIQSNKSDNRVQDNSLGHFSSTISEVKQDAKEYKKEISDDIDDIEEKLEDEIHRVEIEITENKDRIRDAETDNRLMIEQLNRLELALGKMTSKVRTIRDNITVNDQAPPDDDQDIIIGG